MKIRNGFVSNSSSSSFLIYGVDQVSISSLVVSSEFVEKYNQIYKENYTVDSMKKAIEEDDCIDLRDLCEYFGLYSCNCCDGMYVGESWDSVQDNETGAQFKERIKNKIQFLFGNECASRCKTHQETYYD